MVVANFEDYKELGTFVLNGDKLLVSDPCYNRKLDSAVQAILLNAIPGTWNARAYFYDDESWGKRVSCLEVYHESFDQKSNESEVGWRHGIAEVGVDSGLLGVWDDTLYPSDDPGDAIEEDKFFGSICAALESEGTAVTKEGIVSSSGFGDGSYSVDVHRNTAGQIDQVQIVFIAEDLSTLSAHDLDEV